jgi:hypothetical protein
MQITSISLPTILQNVATPITISGSGLAGSAVTFSGGTVVVVTATESQVAATITGLSLGIGIVTVAAGGEVATVALTVLPVAINVALAANGGVATASSVLSATYAVTAINNGDVIGAKWGTVGGGWNDGTINVYPDWAQITFSAQKTIDRVDVFTVQDALTQSVVPTATLSFSKYGITSFDVQYWNGSSWVTVTGGSITGNTLVWRTIAFPAVTTDRIRVQVNASLGGYSRIVEIQAWTSATIATANRPEITGISPTSITQSVPTVVTISGAYLTAATVTFDRGTPGTISGNTATSITVALTGTSVGPGAVTVTTAGGSATVSLPVTATTPIISSVVPVSSPLGVPTAVVITGSNLSGATVTASTGTVSNIVTTANSFTATITGTAVNSGTLTVTTASGSATVAFAVTASTPVITGYSPASIERGTAGIIVITGAGFTGSVVSISGTGLTVGVPTVVADRISVPVTASLTAPVGTGVLSVSNGGVTATANIIIYATSINALIAVGASTMYAAGRSIYAQVRHPITGRYLNPATLAWHDGATSEVIQTLIEYAGGRYSGYISIPDSGAYIVEYCDSGAIIATDTVSITGGDVRLTAEDLVAIDAALTASHGGGVWGVTGPSVVLPVMQGQVYAATARNQRTVILVQGDTPTVTFDLAGDYTGWTVWFGAKGAGTMATRQAQWIDAAKGQGSIDLSIDDTAFTGSFEAEIKLRHETPNRILTAMKFKVLIMAKTT